MDFYNELVNKTDEEVTEITRKRINELEEEYEKNSDDPDENIIGYKLDYNPEYKAITVNGNQEELSFVSRCFYHGYISKKTKVVYGLKYNYEGEICNKGAFYYLEDDSYIYEFCEYIKDKEVEDEYDLMHYILEFMLGYFKKIEMIDREEMHSLIYKDNKTYFPPIRRHLLTDFKDKGNALCSEYAVMAQNLMSMFKISSSIVIGAEKIDNNGLEQHAFNLIELTDPTTGEKKTFLADFQNYIITYDIDYEPIDIMPFLGRIDELSNEFLESFLHEKKELTFEDYGYLVVGDSAFRIGYDRNRTYLVDNVVYGEKMLTKRN